MTISKNNRACVPMQRLTKETLLAMLDNSGVNEIQRIEILRKNGLPDGGSFKLKFGNNVTEAIRYYNGTGSNHTGNLITRALSPYARVGTVVKSELIFSVEFIGTSGGINQPTMSVHTNSLTLGGVSAGSMRILTERKGVSNSGTYNFLKNIPTANWEIASFNPQNGEVCITVNRSDGIANLAVTIPVELFRFN